MFDRGAVHIAVAVYIVDHYLLMFQTGVVHIVVASCLLWLAVLLTVTV